MEVAEVLTAADWETERAQLVSERDEARTALADFEEAAAIALHRQVEAAVAGIRQELSDTEEAAAIALERQITGALERARSDWEKERETLRSKCLELQTERDETSRTAAERERLRNEQATECESLRAECAKLRTELNEASQSLAEIQDGYRRELSEHQAEAAQRERLVQEIHERTKADLVEKCQLLAEIQEAYRRELSEHKNDDAERERLLQELNAAKSSLAEISVSSAGLSVEVMHTETARVDALMKQLSLIIEDPETELSEVMRKTVERSQLEAYLKGLSFSAKVLLTPA